MPIEGSYDTGPSGCPGKPNPVVDTEPTINAQDFSALISKFSNAGFFHWQTSTKQLHFSNSFVGLIGLDASVGEAPKEAILARIHEEDLLKLQRQLEAISEDKESVGLNFRLYGERGELRWYQARLNIAEYDYDGGVKTIIGTVTDIDDLCGSLFASDQSMNQEQWLSTIINKLLQSESDYVFDQCLNKLCEFIGVDHIVLRQVRNDANQFRVFAIGHHQRAQKHFNLTRDRAQHQLPYTFNLLNQGKYQLIGDVDNHPFNDSLRQRLDELNIKALATLPIHYQGNFEFYLSLMMAEKVKDWRQYNLEIPRIIGDTMAMVASRQQISQVLAISEARFQHVVDATGDGLFEWDLEGQRFFVIPTFLYMLGHDEELLPLTEDKVRHLFVNAGDFDDIFTEQENPGHYLAPSCFEKELPMRHANGNIIWVLMRGKHLRWDKFGNATNCVGTSMDISRYYGAGNDTRKVSPNRKPNNEAILAHAKVLLVEDNLINQRVAQGILKSKVASITTANNGKEAIDLLESNPGDFDVILMDVDMPIMDGYQATKLIREDRRFKHMPIIAVTAHVMSEDRERCLQCGMNAHVPKPIIPKDLYRELANCLIKANQLNSH